MAGYHRVIGKVRVRMMLKFGAHLYLLCKGGIIRETMLPVETSVSERAAP